jgi:hypothetical protein
MSLRPKIELRQYRGHVLTLAPATEPVTLAEIKAQLVIDDSADDALLNDMITEARQEIEDVTGIAMIAQGWRLSLDRWPGNFEPWWDGVKQASIADFALSAVPGWVSLPRYPLQQIDGVTVFAEDATSAAVTVASVFDVDTYQTPGRMALKRGQTWPIALRTINAIQIDYTAGYAVVPAPFRRAIKNMVAYMYEHRGDGCTGGDAYVASGAADIVGKYKVIEV